MVYVCNVVKRLRNFDVSLSVNKKHTLDYSLSLSRDRALSHKPTHKHIHTSDLMTNLSGNICVLCLAIHYQNHKTNGESNASVINWPTLFLPEKNENRLC